MAHEARDWGNAMTYHSYSWYQRRELLQFAIAIVAIVCLFTVLYLVNSGGSSPAGGSATVVTPTINPVGGATPLSCTSFFGDLQLCPQ